MLGFTGNIDWERIKKCAYSDKLHIKKRISEYIQLYKECDASGVVAFIDEIKKTTDSFEALGCKLLVSGFTSDIIESMLYTIVHSSSLTDSDYLQKIIFIMFALLRQRADISLVEVECILLSFLGMEFIDEIRGSGYWY